MYPSHTIKLVDKILLIFFRQARFTPNLGHRQGDRGYWHRDV